MPSEDDAPAPSSARLALALVAAVALALIVAALAVSGVLPRFGAPSPEEELGPPEFALAPAGFADLAGWREDRQGEALDAFLRSCARMARQEGGAPANPVEALGARVAVGALAGTVGDWRPVCEAAADVAAPRYADERARDAAARAFFEGWFRPLRVIALRARPGGAREPVVERRGRFTGYYEPVYAASRAADPSRPAPVLARPGDLVMVDLGRFREAFAGQRIAGRVEGGALIPYPDHAAINAGALGRRAAPLAFLDADDLFEMQIQGSGRLRFDDGEELRIGYDGQNGHPYFAVGRALIERGAVSREAMSMAAIRAWLAGADPDEARLLRELNPSYVFFRPLTLDDPALGPLGAEGVQLTPMRSLAVDRRFHPMGAPVWVSVETADGAPLRALFIAQDTGGAIVGPIRGDIFFGAGPEAGAMAGAQNAEGEMFVLLPTPLAARLAFNGAP